MPGTSPSPEEARNFQEASRSATQYSKPSLRWDAAQRACRDGDLKTLKFIIEQAGIFEDKPALREACLSGAWGNYAHSSSERFRLLTGVTIPRNWRRKAAQASVLNPGFNSTPYLAPSSHNAQSCSAGALPPLAISSQRSARSGMGNRC